MVNPSSKFNHTVFESLVSGLMADALTKKSACSGPNDNCEYCTLCRELNEHDIFKEIIGDIAFSMKSHEPYLVGQPVILFFQLGMKYQLALQELQQLEGVQSDAPSQ